MGLFSSKTITTVASVVYPLMGNDGSSDTPDYMQQTIVSASVNGWDVAKRINYYILNGQYFTVKRMFDYAKENYPFGLPTSSYVVTGGTGSSSQFGINHMPALILRYGGKDFLDPNMTGSYTWLGNSVKTGNTALYQSTKKILKMMGVDAESLRKQINDNQNINDIDHAFAVTAVDLATETKWGKQYLYEYFNRATASQTVTQAQFIQDTGENFSRFDALPEDVTVAPSGVRQNTIRYRDQDPYQESYDFTLEWNYINKYTQAGTIGPIGTVERNVGVGTLVKNLTNDMLLFRKQIGPNQLECLEIRGLLHRNNVYKDKFVEITATKAITDKQNTQGFLIPVDMDVLASLPISTRHQLSSEISWLIFNCVDQKKQKWYQSGWFGKLLMLVGFALAIFFPPAGVAALSTASVITAVATMLIVQLIMTLIPKLAAALGKMMGLDSEALAKFVAAITIIATITFMMYGGKLMGSKAAPTAMNWMQMTEAVLKGVTSGVNEYVKMGFEELGKSYEEAEKAFKEAQEKIDDLWDYLTPDVPNIYTVQSHIANTTLALTDTPEVFLRRTLMTAQDVVDLTFMDIEMFVNTNIRLPFVTPANINTGVSIERS